MDANWFRTQGHQMVEYIASYMEGVEERPPLHSVTPGYLRPLIPEEAPETPDSWDDVMKDLDRVLMPGMNHWQSQQFHAYFKIGYSCPSILGDMLSSAFGCVAFSWMSCPAATELEVNMMDWLAKMLQLPEHTLFREDCQGGGVIMTSASESTLVSILSARSTMIKKIKENNPATTTGQLIDKFVAYTSELAHVSVEKASIIALTKLRKLPVDINGSLRANVLEKAIEEDKERGLVPFFCCATIGTTACCSFDDLQGLGPVCDAHDVWLHVDAAYAGGACICPEFRYLLNGVEHCMTFNFNPHKLLCVNYDCSALWVKNKSLLIDAFEVDALYLRGQKHNDTTMPDYWQWQIHLGRRFRSIKLWFVIRAFGVEGLRANIRKDVKLAKQFEAKVLEDKRFEIIGEVVLGLVCFRLKSSNRINERLHNMINNDARIHLVPSFVRGKYVLRFAVVCGKAKPSDITYAWNVILEMTEKIKDEGVIKQFSPLRALYSDFVLYQTLLKSCQI